MSGTATDLLASLGAQTARKRVVTRQVAFAVAEGRCATLEGSVAYRRGDAILTGEVGEVWPVRRDRFEETYDPCPGTTPGSDGPYTTRPAVVRAAQLDRAAEIVLSSDRGTLQARPSDWLVHYGDDDWGVVRDDLFRSAYDLDAGPST